MMSQTTGIIVIDDDRDHLGGLIKELERFGIPCLSLHFTGAPPDIPACPHVRLIFADLHLIGGVASDHKRDFAVIGSIIEDTIKPSGPYLVVLWTRYPDQVSELKTFLQRLRDVTKPVDILSLSKIDHLDGSDIRSEKALTSEIESLAGGWLNTGGLAGLQGALRPLNNDEVDEMIEEIYAARRGDMGRVVELDD